MSKWNLIIDVAECTNCNMCVLACHDEYVGNDYPGYAAEMPKHGHRWIDIERKERGQIPMVDVAYLPTMCNHCDDAPCIAAAENGAVYKREDGIVIIDPDKARGQKQIVESCPYGAVWWNEEKQLPQHWNFDAHLIDAGWKEPRGAQVCATKAMLAIKVEDEEMQRRVVTESLEVLRPGLGTRPRVYYKNFHRYSKCFVGGTVETTADGVTDCVEGVTVTLTKDGGKIAETATDNYGDFKFDRLDEDSGAYTVAVAADGRAAKSVGLTLGKSVYLGAISI